MQSFQCNLSQRIYGALVGDLQFLEPITSDLAEHSPDRRIKVWGPASLKAYAIEKRLQLYIFAREAFLAQMF